MVDGVGIIGVGKYIPANLRTNFEIEKGCGLYEGYIAEKTGIISRYFASQDEHASDMAYAAAINAMSDASISANDIDLIICCTFTADYVYPSLSCKLHKMLGARNAGTFDIMANCTGFQVGLSVAADRMKVDPDIKKCLVIGVALQNRFIDWTDPNSCIYFGDGAGAAILSQVPKGYGILSTQVTTNSTAYEAVRMRGGGSSFPLTKENIGDRLQFYELNGLEVWKQAIVNQPKVIKSSLAKIGKTVDDVDFFIFHQANKNLIEYMLGKMKRNIGDAIINIEKYGNTADASIAIALFDAVKEGRLKRNDLVVMSGVGAGFIFGSTVLRWH